MNFSKTIIALLLLAFLANSLHAQRRKTDPDTRKKGFVDRKGNVVVPFVFDKLPYDYDTVMPALKGRFCGLIDGKGRTIIPFEYKDMHPRVEIGFVMVRKPNGLWGIANTQGKFMLPIEFEMVGAIDRDMLASRRKGEKEVQFYNGVGQPTFKLPGLKVEKGFDANSMLVRGLDDKSRYLTRTGEPIFPESIPNPTWTDGNLIICGGYETMGIQNFRGEIILPLVHRAVWPALPGQFKVQNQSHEYGIVDGSGRTIIPFARWEIVKYDNFYRVNTSVGSKYGLFSADGKVILPAEYNLWEFKETEPFDGDSDDSPSRFFKFGMPNKPYLKGFYSAKDASQILPIEYYEIFYRSENFPLLAVKRFEYPAKNEAMAFDLTGKPLLSAPVVGLQHTENPRCLLAYDGKMSGFLDLDGDPAETEFFHRVYPTSTPGFYTAWGPDSVVTLLKSCGEKLYSGKLASTVHVHESNRMFFKRQPNTSGELILIGKKVGMGDYEWIAVNDAGQEFLMSEPRPETTTASTESTEPEVVQIEKPAVEAPVEPKTAPPVVEEKVVEMVDEAPPPPVEKTQKVDVEEVVEAPPPAVEEVAVEEVEDPEKKIWPNFSLSPGAEYPGGIDSLAAAMVRFLKHPPGETCTLVRVTFIVEKDGSLSDPKIKGRPSAACGEEALRFVRSMPRWSPGKKYGREVRSEFILPVIFKR